MRSALIILALFAAVSATALLRQPPQEHLTKEVKQHQKPKGLVKFYYDTYVATGSANVLDGMFCKICLDLVDGLENFGEETAMDYLEEYTKEMCDELPFDNLQKDCYNYIVGIAQDLIDLVNNNIGGQQACTLMTLC